MNRTSGLVNARARPLESLRVSLDQYREDSNIIMSGFSVIKEE